MITGRAVTVAAAFAEDQPAMAPLPDEAFDPARLLQARASGALARYDRPAPALDAYDRLLTRTIP